MHPLESKAHRAIFDVIYSKDDRLNYEYYIYNIDVTKDIDNKDECRMDGQVKTFILFLSFWLII